MFSGAPEELPMPLPSDEATDFFLDPNRGDAYGLGENSKNGPRNFLQNIINSLNDVSGQAKSLAGDKAVKLGDDGRYRKDGRLVTGGIFGIQMPGFFPSDADVFKVRREAQVEDALAEKTDRNKVLGIGADGNLITGQAGEESLYNRAKAVGLTKKGPFVSPTSGGISNAVDLNLLEKTVKTAERKKDLVTVAGDEGLSLEDLKTPEGKLKSVGKLTKLIEAQNLLNRENVQAGSEDRATKRKLNQEAANLGLSTQATNGLNMESGQRGVQQRSQKIGGREIPPSLQDDPSLPLAERVRRAKALQEVQSARIAANETFNNPTNTYARSVDIYKDKKGDYLRKLERQQQLQDREAQFQFQREQQQMNHEQRQFEIRETNKMLREQWEKELEIEEQRRSEADFDSLTRMIMGLAGNL